MEFYPSENKEEPDGKRTDYRIQLAVDNAGNH